jgi:hypothetical protein
VRLVDAAPAGGPGWSVNLPLPEHPVSARTSNTANCGFMPCLSFNCATGVHARRTGVKIHAPRWLRPDPIELQTSALFARSPEVWRTWGPEKAIWPLTGARGAEVSRKTLPNKGFLLGHCPRGDKCGGATWRRERNCNLTFSALSEHKSALDSERNCVRTFSAVGEHMFLRDRIIHSQQNHDQRRSTSKRAAQQRSAWRPVIGLNYSGWMMRFSESLDACSRIIAIGVARQARDVGFRPQT